MENDADYQPMSVRLPIDLYHQVVAAARDEDRSISSLIRKALAMYLREKAAA
jgi:hypothetical protein